MIGASDSRIMRSHVIPHLIAPIIVYSTLTVATYILLEAGLSFLGLGIDPVNPSWGNLLATAPDLLHDPAVVDGLAGPRDPVDDPLLQSPGRRDQGRDRPALESLT